MKTMHKAMLLMIVCVFIGSLCFSAALSERKSEDLMRSIRPSSDVPVSSQTDRDVIEGYYRFSHDLVRHAGKTVAQNVMVSPISVYLALAMTANGARNETKQEMLQVLSDGASLEAVDRSAAAWLKQLKTAGKETVLSIANSIWFQQDYQVAKAFLQANADYYSATANGLDFNHPKAAATINDWVAKETRDKITSIIERTSADMLMVLVNASYFKSVWEDPFEVKRTREETFHAVTGDIPTPFMRSSRWLTWTERHQAQTVMIPYKDRHFWFFATLPDAGLRLREWLETVDGRSLFALLADPQTIGASEVELSLPTFTAEYEDSLVDDLAAMGMKTPFQASLADFSGMSAAGTKDMFISEVKHKTFIQVDEAGTEAAAATAVTMKATAVAPRQVKHITFDRPFLYGIVDSVTKLVLFVGLMDSPSAP